MKKLCVTFLFLVASAALAAEPILIVQDGKLFYSAGDGKPATYVGPASALHNVHYMDPADPTDPTDPTDPPVDPPDDPDLSERAQAISDLSVPIGDKEGAYAFAAMVATTARALGEDESINEFGWGLLTDAVLSGVSDEKHDAWETWVADVGELAEDEYGKQFFTDVEDGLDHAYSLDDELVEALVADAMGVATAEHEASLARAGLGGIDIDTLLRIINSIIEILRALGIIT